MNKKIQTVRVNLIKQIRTWCSDPCLLPAIEAMTNQQLLALHSALWNAYNEGCEDSK
jgi:hypothetical protein